MKLKLAAVLLIAASLMSFAVFASFPEDTFALVLDSEHFKDIGFDSASHVLASVKAGTADSFVLVYYSRYDLNSKSLIPYIRSFADKNKTTVYGIDQYNKYTQEYGYFNKNSTLVGWEDFIDKQYFSFPAVFVYNADVRMMFTASGISSILEFTGLLSEAGMIQSGYHDLVKAGRYAERLQRLNLFKGTDEGFELLKKPTRVEALVMLIRLLGKEEEALSYKTRTHPFTDVPSWAHSYVSYAYDNGITTGVSERRFGADNAVTAAQYLTFVLRALSYDSAEKGDFVWSDPYRLAMEAGILPQGVNTAAFLRADMVIVTYSALSARIKNTDVMLCDRLVISGRITKEALKEATGIDSRFASIYPEEIPESE